MAGGGPAAILINARDAVKSRMFTLFHEYAHVLLGGGSLCHPDPESLDASPKGSGAKIEGWCDDFAASILMPRTEFLEALQSARGAGELGNVDLSLSRRFRMSRRAVRARAASEAASTARPHADRTQGGRARPSL